MSKTLTRTVLVALSDRPGTQSRTASTHNDLYEWLMLAEQEGDRVEGALVRFSDRGEGAIDYKGDETTLALDAVRFERERQLEGGLDGVVTTRDGLIAVALAYLGRAVEGAQRNDREGHDPKEMLIKAAAVLVDAIAREG